MLYTHASRMWCEDCLYEFCLFPLEVRLWNKFLSSACIIVWCNYCRYFWTLKTTALWKISHVSALWDSLDATIWLQHCCLGKEKKLVVWEIIILIVYINQQTWTRTCILFYSRYKRASKTDVKCSWLKHPKSAPPKSTVTMSDLYPPKQQEYSYVSQSDTPSLYFDENFFTVDSRFFFNNIKWINMFRALTRKVTDDDRAFLYNQLGQLGRFTGCSSVEFIFNSSALFAICIVLLEIELWFFVDVLNFKIQDVDLVVMQGSRNIFRGLVSDA